jgi:hypothetical protein
MKKQGVFEKIEDSIGSSKIKNIFISFIIVTACANVLAAQGRWTEGFGQGNLEYFIDQDGFRLYIGCPTEDGSADSQSSVSLIQLSNDNDIQNFTIDVNGVSYDGPFSADSRVGENNFLSLLENLRKGNAIVKFGGKSIKFPKSNAAKVIPVYGKNFSCNISV